MKRVPHQPEAEQALLAAALQSKDTFLDLSVVLPSAAFYAVQHSMIWTAMGAVMASKGTTDLTGVKTHLRRQDLLERCSEALSALEAFPAVLETASAVDAVLDAYKLRRIYTEASTIANQALDYPEDAQAFLEHVEGTIFALGESSLSATLQTAEEISPSAVDHLERLATLGTKLIGTPTNFIELDELTNGLQPGMLVTLGARPGIGKTTLALDIGLNAAEAGYNVLMFSLEMSHLELTMSAYAGMAMVDRKRFKNGRLTEAEWGRLGSAVERFSKLPLWIDDGNCSVSEVEAKSRRFKARAGKLDLLVIDYLQIMPDVDSANAAQSISKMTRRLKMLAKELQCPILLLSQLNRKVEERPDKRPMLADLRDSGAIEADSTMVWFLFRESYYDPSESDRRGIAELIVAKNRFGPTGTYELAFLEGLPLFANLDALI